MRPLGAMCSSLAFERYAVFVQTGLAGFVLSCASGNCTPTWAAAFVTAKRADEAVGAVDRDGPSDQGRKLSLLGARPRLSFTKNTECAVAPQTSERSRSLG